jgi:endonuclease III
MTRFKTILARLEKFYGRQTPVGPTDAYEMILYRNCGYPQSDERCAKGFAALKKQIGLSPKKILDAPDAKLREAMRAGGMSSELRARRLKEIAARVEEEFDGDLRTAMRFPLAEAKKALKKFPTIGDSGAEKILLFTKTAPAAAVPSNAVHVPLRLGFGTERKNWAASYREAQQAILAELAEEHEALLRAYLLLKRHGEELCKTSRPKCEECPITDECAYYKKARGE